jgi:hypothetical protein
MEDLRTLRRAALMALLIVLVIGPAQSWDNAKAHPKINELAFDRFVTEWMPKDENLKQASIANSECEGEAWDPDMGIVIGLASTDLYIPVVNFQNIQYKSEDRKKTIKDWLISGGFSADEPEAPQALRHFYDPEREPHYLTDFVNDMPWTSSLNPATSARDWAFGNTSNLYSFPKARRYFMEAVAVPDAPGNVMYGKAWRAIGETMHLISDMTVPAHVRNDCHIPFTAATRDPFEFHTTDTDVEAYGTGNYPPASSINYKRTYPGQGDLSSLMHDVAKWTNNNFFSRDTLPIEGKTTTANGKEAYQLPAISWPVKPGYYMGKVDGKDIILAKASLAGFLWKSTQLELDANVWSSYYRFLIPTAIEASAAVLDAFLPRYEVKIDSIKQDPSNKTQYIVQCSLNLIKTNVWPDPSELIVKNGATLKVVNKKTGKENDWPVRCPQGGDLNKITWKGQLEPGDDEITLEYNLGGYVIISKPSSVEERQEGEGCPECPNLDYSKLNKGSDPYSIADFYLDANGNIQGKYIGYYDNARTKIECKGCYLDGDKTGPWTCYWENGKLEYVGCWRNGEKEGYWKDYWENGNLSWEGSFKDDKEEGHFEDSYFPDLPR